MPKISEAIIASLLRLHNNPELRLKAKVNLGVVVAPYTEFTYIHQHSSSIERQEFLEEREKRFKCAEQAFLSTMRSWSGLCQLCQSRQIGPSHLQAVVDILYLNNNEVRVSFWSRILKLRFHIYNYTLHMQYFKIKRNFPSFSSCCWTSLISLQ